MTNIFSSFDKEIWDFANLPGNEPLLRRTGSYSTLMRGGLFGKFRQDEVELELQTRRVDVLILGSNPNAGDHQPDAVRPKYGTLPMQMATGMLGEQIWDCDRRSSPGWNFLVDSNEGWKYFRGLLANELTTLDSVAMANFIPWGSKDISSLVNAEGIDRNLLNRMLRFCEQLNGKLVAVLRPKIVIVPRSLTKNLALSNAFRTKYLMSTERPEEKVLLKEKRQNFFFCSGGIEFNGFTTETLHVNHPASFIYIGKQDRTQVASVLGPMIRKAVAA